MKKAVKFISVMLSLAVSMNSLTALAAYNGTSSAQSKSSGGSGSLTYTISSYDDQGMRVSLYFCQMPAEITSIPDREERRQKMAEYWTNASNIIQIGSTVDISRDTIGQKGKGFGAYYYKGNIAASDLFGAAQSEQLKAPRDKPKSDGRLTIKASDIGLDSATLPMFITDNPGKATDDYFMDENPEHATDENKAEYIPTGYMKNLIHYISYPSIYNQDNTKYEVSFLSDQGTDRFNENSVFEMGSYKGQYGEYKLFIEDFIVVNNTAMTFRDMHYWMSQNTGAGKGTPRYDQGNTIAKLGNALYLNTTDAFGLQKANGTISKYTGANSAVNNNEGYGVNILSSELFRDPATRSIGSHINIFLPFDAHVADVPGDSPIADTEKRYTTSGTQNTGVLSIGMEFIGNKVDTSKVYKSLQEILSKKLVDADDLNTTVFTNINTAQDILNQVSVEVNQYYNELGIDSSNIEYRTQIMTDFLTSEYSFDM